MQIDAMGEIGFYAINLRSSKERWATILSAAQNAGIDLSRIDAVDGRKHDVNGYSEFDLAKFMRCNGRPPLPGEIGCYRSHVRALRAFYDSDAASAVILEDDAPINSKLMPYARMLSNRFSDHRWVVRLSAHRAPLFEKLEDGLDGYALGQCWFGPTGSASAYWVSRPAAGQLLTSLLPGYLPFDVMLERSWETGVTTLQVKPNLLPIPQPPSSDIGSTAGLETRKFPWYRRVNTMLFRSRQLSGRILHCAHTRTRHDNAFINGARLYDADGR